MGRAESDLVLGPCLHRQRTPPLPEYRSLDWFESAEIAKQHLPPRSVLQIPVEIVHSSDLLIAAGYSRRSSSRRILYASDWALASPVNGVLVIAAIVEEGRGAIQKVRPAII